MLHCLSPSFLFQSIAITISVSLLLPFNFFQTAGVLNHSAIFPITLLFPVFSLQISSSVLLSRTFHGQRQFNWNDFFYISVFRFFLRFQFCNFLLLIRCSAINWNPAGSLDLCTYAYFIALILYHFFCIA